MTAFDIGLSALRTSQFALNVVSNNISNANTEGYHRRTVHLEALSPNHLGRFRIGSGVAINNVDRIRDHVTEVSLTNAISDLSHVEQLLVVERQIETAFMSGSTSIGEELDQFFAEMTQLTAAPDEPAQRAAVLEVGQRMAGMVRQGARQLNDLKSVVRFQITQEVDALNQNMKSLSKLSTKIDSLTAQGFDTSAELDQRDALLNQIADVVGIGRNDYTSGSLNFMIGNASIQQGNSASEFAVLESDDGSLGVALDDSDRPANLTSGRLLALLEVYNSTIPKYADKLDQLAVGLMQNIDSTHATGIGTAGGFQHLAATRLVNNASIPLIDAGTTFPVQAGELTISIVDPDGTRRTETISIDPGVDTLNDVASRLKAIDGLNAAVNPKTTQLQIFANDGVKFDFTGNIETNPRLDNVTGTSLPTFSGVYTGTGNEQRNFEIEGTGDVGVSNELFLNVYDEGGSLINRVNIGNGYEAGTEIDTGDGIMVSFSRGTVNDGNTFAARLTGNPDETGILAALGLNSFFSGINASSINVDSTLLSNPDRFAIGKSGDAADTLNLFQLTALEDSTRLPGDLTLSEFVNEINTEIGFQVNTDTALSSSLQSLKTRLEQERDSYSAVDLNEEMVYLQEYQKSYEAAVRVIQTADNILNELFGILR